MDRFIFKTDYNELPVEKADVLIIGSGIAGLYAALHLDPSMKVTVITKATIEKSNSWLAQGGIASFFRPLSFLDILVVCFLKENRISDIKIGIHIGSYKLRFHVKQHVASRAPFGSPILPFLSILGDRLFAQHGIAV